MAIAQPLFINIPFSNSGLKTNTIPNNDDSGVGNASWEQGFPPETMKQIAQGGVPPRGQDMNGILNKVTLILQYLQSGTPFKYNSAFASSIGGYPKGALVLSTDNETIWRNTVDGNATDPDNGGTNWVNFLAQFGNYLPLAGGTMTGTITANVENIIKRSVNNGNLSILGGTAAANGGRLELYGASRSTNPGAFLLTTGTVSSKYCQLLAKPDGTLTWSGTVPAASTDSTQIATTAYVKDCLPKSIGSSTKLTYTNSNGVLTASDADVGSSNVPVYLEDGVLKAAGKSFGDYLPLAGGTLTGTLTVSTNARYYKQANGINIDAAATAQHEAWMAILQKNPAQTTNTGDIVQYGAYQLNGSQDIIAGFRIANPRGTNKPAAGGENNTANLWTVNGIYFHYDVNRAFAFSNDPPPLDHSVSYYHSSHLANVGQITQASIPKYTTIPMYRAVDDSWLQINGGKTSTTGALLELHGSSQTGNRTFNGDTFLQAGHARLYAQANTGTVDFVLDPSTDNKNGINRLLSTRSVVVDGNHAIAYIYNDTNLTYDTNPTSDVSRVVVQYNDKNGQRVAAFTATKRPSGETFTSINVLKAGTTNAYTGLYVGWGADGLAYANAPSTRESPSNQDIITYDFLNNNVNTAKNAVSVNGQLNAVASGKVWFKVADVICNGGYWTRNAVLLVRECTSINVLKTGILELRLRAEANATTINTAQTSLKWLSKANSFVNTDFALVYRTSGSNTVFELWCRCPNSYQAYQFVVLSTSDGQKHYPFLNFYSGRSADGSTALPSGTVIYSDDSESDLNKGGGTMTGILTMSAQIRSSVAGESIRLTGLEQNGSYRDIMAYHSSGSYRIGGIRIGANANANYATLGVSDQNNDAPGGVTVNRYLDGSGFYYNMSGYLDFTLTNKTIYSPNNTGDTFGLYSGTGWNTSPSISLYPSDGTNSAKGSFYIRAGKNSYALYGDASGNLNWNGANFYLLNTVAPAMYLRASDIIHGTAPSANRFPGITIQDKNGQRVAKVEYSHSTDGKQEILFLITKQGATATYGRLGIGCDSSGNYFTEAPTPAQTDDSTKIATTAYVKDCIPKSVGSGTKPVYTNANGVVTASGSTVGSANEPVYMSSGTITKCSMNSASAAGLVRITNQTVNQTGYVKLASGLILQWGVLSANGDVTFSTPFTKNPSVTLGHTGGDYSKRIANLSTTGFTATGRESASYIGWIAIGV